MTLNKVLVLVWAPIGALVIVGVIALLVQGRESMPHVASSSSVPLASPVIVPATEEGALRDYVFATAHDAYTSTNIVTDTIDACIEGDHAASSATASSACVHRAALNQRRGVLRLEAVTAAGELEAAHAELLAIARDQAAALDALDGALAQHAGALDQQRGRHPWSAWWNGDGDTPDLNAVQSVAASHPALDPRWMAWVHMMSVSCNDHLRCLEGRIQVNCPWARVAAVVNEGTSTRVLLASETTLPRFVGGME